MKADNWQQRFVSRHRLTAQPQKVINGEICYNQKEVNNLHEMFHTRYSLFKRVYSHKVGKAIELMIVDALVAADKILHISDAIDNPEAYSQLTDGILRTIENSKDDALEESRNIIKRIRKRQLYKFVEEYSMSAEMEKYLSPSEINACVIASQDATLEVGVCSCRMISRRMTSLWTGTRFTTECAKTIRSITLDSTENGGTMVSLHNSFVSPPPLLHP